MKIFRRLILLILALSLVLCLVACGETAEVCKKHVDEDEDGICDKCEKEIEGEEGEVGEGIALIENEEVLFQIVLGSDVTSATLMQANALASIIEDLGAELSVVKDSASAEEWDVEVLVGTVTSRGADYEYDKYSLGPNGYAITAIDETKILITGGSEASLAEAFETFVSDILGLDEDSDVLENVYFTEEHEDVAPQDDFKVSDVTIGGKSIKGYTIARDKSNSAHNTAASQLQNFFYSRAGIWLPIVELDKATSKSIVITTVGKGQAGSVGFRARVDGSKLLIECAHNNKFTEGFDDYYNNNFSMVQGKLELKDYVSKDVDISVISYREMGAVGDGHTDDSAAIRAAHNAANEGGQTVIGEKGKTYYIPTLSEPIYIKTDVDWKGATFIFDDSKMNKSTSGYRFMFVNDYEAYSFKSTSEEIKKLNENKDEDGFVIKGAGHPEEERTKKLDLGLGYPALLTVYNENNSVYIRWGYVDSKDSYGKAQHEIILVDENGNIDPSTPFLLDYDNISSIRVDRADTTPVTAKNATFRTIACQQLVTVYESYTHGIDVRRSNVTIENVTHIVEGEIAKNAPARYNSAKGVWEDVTSEGYTYSGGVIKKNGQTVSDPNIKAYKGPSYGGFINVQLAHNTLIKNTVFQARTYYDQGTYDITCTDANKIVFENCEQSNFFDQRDYCTAYGNSTIPNLSLCWGIAGTNYCKNMDYINCSLTRYDAHSGVYNGKIIGGNLAVLRLIGGGDFIMDGVTIYHNTNNGSAPLQLREDYGATFNGTLTVKNCVIEDAYYSAKGSYGTVAALIDAPSANWDFGYQTYFPNLVIENLTVRTKQTTLNLLLPGGETYSASNNHFPSRSIAKTKLNDPDAKFATYYDTKDKNLVTNKPTYLPFLEGKKEGKDYKVVDNGNGTYTIVVTNAPNINPYTPPESISFKGSFTNLDGKAITMAVYKCDFLAQTNITTDGVKVTRPKP